MTSRRLVQVQIKFLLLLGYFKWIAYWIFFMKLLVFAYVLFCYFFSFSFKKTKPVSYWIYGWSLLEPVAEISHFRNFILELPIRISNWNLLLVNITKVCSKTIGTLCRFVHNFELFYSIFKKFVAYDRAGGALNS